MANEAVEQVYAFLKRFEMEDLDEAIKYCDENANPGNSVSYFRLRRVFDSMIDAKKTMIRKADIRKKRFE